MNFVSPQILIQASYLVVAFLFIVGLKRYMRAMTKGNEKARISRTFLVSPICAGEIFSRRFTRKGVTAASNAAAATPNATCDNSDVQNKPGKLRVSPRPRHSATYLVVARPSPRSAHRRRPRCRRSPAPDR